MPERSSSKSSTSSRRTSRRNEGAAKRLTVPENTPRNYAERWYAIIIFATSALLWGVILMGQVVGGDIRRWMLFLVPIETVSGWLDGPVSLTGLLPRIGVLMIACLAMAPAFGGGMLFIKPLPWVRRLEPLEKFTAAVVAGLAIQATTLLCCGAAGLFGSWFMILLWPASTITVGYGLGRLLYLVQGDGASESRITVHGSRDSSDPGKKKKKRKQHYLWVPQILFGIFSVLLIARALLPPVEYDVREYHLQGPKQWWLSGQLNFLPENIYANMPMAAEIHTTGAMQIAGIFLPTGDAWWTGMLAGKVIIATSLLLMALIVGGVLRILTQDTKKDSRWISNWGRVFVIGFPALFEEATLGLIEPALACFLAWGLLAWTATMRWGSEVENSLERPAAVSLILSLFFAAGGAIGCKYTAVIMVFPILFALGWIAIKEGSYRKEIEWMSPLVVVCAMLLFFLAGGGWLVKNAILAGNPVYPLAAQYLGGATMTPDKIQQWNEAHKVPGYEIGQVFAALADVSWRWRLQGWVLLPLAVTAVFTSARTREVWGLLVMIFAVFILWWGITHRVDRFLSPLIPLVAVVAGLGLQRLLVFFPRKHLAFVVTLMVGMNLVYVAGPAIGDSRLAVDLSYLRLDDSSESSVSRLPDHVVWANKNLDSSSRLLIVGDAAVVDYEMPIAYSTTFDTSPVVELLTTDQPEIQTRFAESGFTHVLVAWGEIDRLRNTYGFDERINREAIEQLVSGGILNRIDTGLPAERAEVFEVVTEVAATANQTQ